MNLKKNLRKPKAQAAIEYIVVFIAFALVIAGFLSRVQGIFSTHFSSMTAHILR